MFSHNETIVRTAIETINTGALDTMGQFFSEDVRRYGPESPYSSRGLAAYREHLAAVRAACADGQLVIEDTILTNDLVAFWWTYRGTQPVGTLGALAVRVPVALTGCQVMRLEAARIVEVWEMGDDLAQLVEAVPVAMPIPVMA